MPFTGQLITKQTVYDQFNGTITNPKNSVVTWVNGNSGIAAVNAVIAGFLGQMGGGDIPSSLIYGSEITNTVRNYAALSTRIRLLRNDNFLQGNCGSFQGSNGPVYAAMNTGFQISSLINGINSVPGPSGLITAASVINYINSVNSFANQSLNGTWLVVVNTFFCHCNCHSSCHGSRARR